MSVVLSQTAVDTFEAIRNQILNRLGEKAAADFDKNTLKVIRSISRSPFAYKCIETNHTVRRALIKGLSSVFYEIKKDEIEILFFWNNRQEPLHF